MNLDELHKYPMKIYIFMGILYTYIVTILMGKGSHIKKITFLVDMSAKAFSPSPPSMH